MDVSESGGSLSPSSEGGDFKAVAESGDLLIISGPFLEDMVEAAWQAEDLPTGGDFAGETNLTAGGDLAKGGDFSGEDLEDDGMDTFLALILLAGGLESSNNALLPLGVALVLPMIV